MPNNCAVAHCKNRYDICVDLHFFKFPKNIALRKQWIVFCQRAGRFNADTSRICSRHFEESDFQNLLQFREGFAKCIMLKRGAVPKHFKFPQKTESMERTIKKRSKLTNHISLPPDITETSAADSTESKNNIDLIQQLELEEYKTRCANMEQIIAELKSKNDQQNRTLTQMEREIEYLKSSQSK